MLRFCVNNIEQLDLALEHVAKGDPNNARFGMMLTDNVVEITLHKIAKEQASKLTSIIYRDQSYEHVSDLEKAMGRHFEPKVRFAVLTDKIDKEVGDSINIFHSFRNDIYHVGLQHEAILPQLAIFYFKIASDFLSSFSTNWIGWNPGQKLPERAQKYFEISKFCPGTLEKYQAGCLKMGKSLKFCSSDFSETLADHLDEIIDQNDIAIETIATGGPRVQNRTQAIIDSQAWQIAFSEKGKRFTLDQHWSGGSVWDHVVWIANNYLLTCKYDPISKWKKRADSVRREKNPHKSLKKYRDFMRQTEDIRDILEGAHTQVEAYIDEQIDRMRGK